METITFNVSNEMLALVKAAMRDDMEEIAHIAAESAAKKVMRKYGARPLHVNQKEAAKMLNRSVPTIKKLLAAGKLKLNGCGMIPMWQIDALLEKCA